MHRAARTTAASSTASGADRRAAGRPRRRRPRLSWLSSHLPIPCVGTASPRIEASHGPVTGAEARRKPRLQTRRQPRAQDHRDRGRGPRRGVRRAGLRRRPRLAVAGRRGAARAVRRHRRASTSGSTGRSTASSSARAPSRRQLRAQRPVLPRRDPRARLPRRHARSPCSPRPRTRSGSRRASRTTSMRVQSLNRQLMDVGELGHEMNAALPYRETVDRVLSRSQDFPARRLRRAAAARRRGARLLARGRPGRAHAHALRRLLRVHAGLPRAAGHRQRADHARCTDHACTLFPHTMKAQLVIPVNVENVGDMALLATSTAATYVDLLTDDILRRAPERTCRTRSATRTSTTPSAVRWSPTTSRASTTGATS